MKFLCPQCKAKYRIADEKLAERASSKMKCRKCGHVIDILTAQMPDSIHPPPPAGVEASTGRADAGRADAGRADADSNGADDGANDAPRAGVPRVVPAAGAQAKRPAGVAPPRRVAAPAPKRGVAPPRRTGGGAAVAQAVESATPDEHRAVEAAAAPPPKNEFEEDAPTRIHDGGALSAALFSMGERGGATPPPAAVEEWYVGINGSPVGPLTMAAVREKAASGEATGDSLVWKDGFEDWKPLSSFPELAALVEEAKESAPATVPLSPAPAPAPAAAAPRPVVSEPPADMLEELGVRKRRHGPHPAAWIAVVVALAFGVTIGVVLFSKTELRKVEVVKIVEVEKAGGQTPAPGDSAEVLEESTVSGNGNGKRSGAPAAKVGNPAPQASSAGMLQGLGGLDVGPASGKGPDVAVGSSPGGQLDGTAIQRVVANFTPSVRRGCWQPALEGRAADAPSSARVSMAITVGASGNVDNVTTSGDPRGYPGLARCIQSKVSSWKFPRSSGTTTVNVPFVFAAQ